MLLPMPSHPWRRPTARRSHPRVVLLALLTSLALLLPAGGVAVAQHPTDSAGPRQHFKHEHKSKKLRPSCVKKMRLKGKPRKARKCRGRITNVARRARKLHQKDLSSQQLGIVGSGGETLRQAFERGANIRYRTFAQDGITVIGAKQLYGERHVGGGFFDGQNVWIDKPGGGPRGFHDCFPTSERGFDVTIESCSVQYKDPGGMTPYYQYWMRWNVAFGWGPINPLKFHYDVHVNLHGSGRLTYWVGDSKRGDDPA